MVGFSGGYITGQHCPVMPVISTGLTQQQLAEAVGITRVRINEVICGKRGITPYTACRLSRYFGTTAEFWLNLQRNLDMWDTLKAHEADYDRIKPHADADA